jgi:6-phosphogluconate dehydrogenase
VQPLVSAPCCMLCVVLHFAQRRQALYCTRHLVSQRSCRVVQGIDKKQLVEDVAKTLYAAKICSYAQGMNIIKAKSAAKEWNINLGALARIWKVSSCFCATHLDCNQYGCQVKAWTNSVKPVNPQHAAQYNGWLQGGCIIRAVFLDEIKQAYERNPALENLLMDEYFARKLADHQESWRRVVKQAIDAGVQLRCIIYYR